jgi:hypothetical protein
MKYDLYIERIESGIKSDPRTFFKFANMKRNSSGYPEKIKLLDKIKHLDTTMTFLSLVKTITSKSARMLGFIKRISRYFNDHYTGETLFVSLVRPNLGYAACVWSPLQVCHSEMLLLFNNTRGFNRGMDGFYGFMASYWNLGLFIKDKCFSGQLLPVCHGVWHHRPWAMGLKVTLHTKKWATWKVSGCRDKSWLR